jgi:hypothetical protein
MLEASQYATSNCTTEPLQSKQHGNWHKNRQEDQRIRTRDQCINAHIYSQVNFDKAAQNTQWRNDSLFNKCSWENWIPTCRRLKLVPCLSPCTKINTKWIKDLNIKPETLKQFKELVANILGHTVIGKNVLSSNSKASKRKIEQVGLHHSKELLQSKRPLLDSRESPQDGRKPLPATHTIRD